MSPARWPWPVRPLFPFCNTCGFAVILSTKGLARQSAKRQNDHSRLANAVRPNSELFPATPWHRSAPVTPRKSLIVTLAIALAVSFSAAPVLASTSHHKSGHHSSTQKTHGTKKSSTAS
jgi:hypothetical protein